MLRKKEGETGKLETPKESSCRGNSASQAARSLRAERQTYMLTLQELKRIADIPVSGEKLPTAKQLRITGLLIAQEQLGKDAEISVFQNGCVLYQVGTHSTVFSLHLCRDYFYISEDGETCLPGQFFEHEQWYLRLILEGEDRLGRNHEERERHWNVSYSTISGDWPVTGELPESVLEHLEKQETMTEIFQGLPERQKYILRQYYLQEKTQKQISGELGISQQAVSAIISRAIRSIRKSYPDLREYPGRGICCREERA